MLRGVVFLALSAASPALSGETLRLRPGASATLRLTENPSTGYTWRLDAAASVGLDRVAIADGGHQRGENLPGAPGTHLWTVRALKPGKVTIHFAYRRPWESAPVETRDIVVEVSGQNY